MIHPNSQLSIAFIYSQSQISCLDPVINLLHNGTLAFNRYLKLKGLKIEPISSPSFSIQSSQLLVTVFLLLLSSKYFFSMLTPHHFPPLSIYNPSGNPFVKWYLESPHTSLFLQVPCHSLFSSSLSQIATSHQISRFIPIFSLYCYDQYKSWSDPFKM